MILGLHVAGEHTGGYRGCNWPHHPANNVRGCEGVLLYCVTIRAGFRPADLCPRRARLSLTDLLSPWTHRRSLTDVRTFDFIFTLRCQLHKETHHSPYNSHFILSLHSFHSTNIPRIPRQKCHETPVFEEWTPWSIQTTHPHPPTPCRVAFSNYAKPEREKSFIVHQNNKI